MLQTAEEQEELFLFEGGFLNNFVGGGSTICSLSSHCVFVRGRVFYWINLGSKLRGDCDFASDWLFDRIVGSDDSNPNPLHHCDSDQYGAYC